MNKKFYVDINQLKEYSKFLNKCVNNVNNQITLLTNANNQYNNLIKDNISVQVNDHITKLKKVYDDFSQEINRMSKKVNKDFELYEAYSKKIN